MTVDEVKTRSEIFKTFGSQYGVWKTEFESMALKTVTKLNLSRMHLYRLKCKSNGSRSDGNKSFDTNGGIEGVHRCYHNLNPEEISEKRI
jgi:hypothetical protein